MAASDRAAAQGLRRPGTAGLILCGGRSSRMGVDKATLRFPGGTLLGRTLERMRAVTDVVALSVSDGWRPEGLPPGVLTVADREAYPGPLWALAEGFRCLQGRAQRVIVIPVDMPFLTPEWIARLADGLDADTDDGTAAGQPPLACLYRFEGFANALTAAYDLGLLPKLERLTAEGQRRPIFLSQGEPTRVLEGDGAQGSATGHPLTDVDTPEAYRDALLCEDVGQPGGAPVTVQVRLPADGPDAPDGLVALYADTAGQVRQALRRLYPELDAPGGVPWRLLRETPDGGRSALEEAATLAPGERLWAGPER